MSVPGFLLRKLYVPGSLRATPKGVAFRLQNPFMNTTLTGLQGLWVGDAEVAPAQVDLRVAGEAVDPRGIEDGRNVVFPRGAEAEVQVRGVPAIAGGRLQVRLAIDSAEFGALDLTFEDAVRPA